MEKLKGLIEQHSRWTPLIDYIRRIETFVHSDFGLALENSKSLLESISKEICDAKNIELGKTESTSSALKKACKAIGYSGDDLITQLSTSIANIGHQMGNLRNEIGSTSHGRTMEELTKRNDGIDELSKEFLIDTTELVSSLLIKIFENENSRQIKAKQRIRYEENEDFNEFWDELHGDFQMGEDYSYVASEIFFNVDYDAYVTEHSNYIQSNGDDSQ